MKRLALTLIAFIATVAVIMAQDGSRSQLTKLPHIYIETFSGQDPTSKTTEVPARLWIVEAGREAYYDSVLIRGRGNSTWKMEKKPYRIKFPQKERFMGPERANAKKWTLLANHGDKSLLRNALASYVGDLCGQTFTPGAMFVDLTLNGQYRGNYQVSDQIDVRKHRVDIAEQDEPLTPESNISGGYIVEADGFRDYVDGKTGWRTSLKGVPMTIHYPADDEITTSQLTYIRNVVNTFESRLFNNTFESALSYRHYVDTLALVSWYLASEITANPDFIWSMYFYKDRDDDRLHFGPMWDYDIAFDNDNRLSGHTPQRELMADIGFTNNGLEQWIGRMWQDEWFQRLVFDHYKTLCEDRLEQKLISKIDSLAALLDASQQLNYERWNIRQRTLREVVIYSTYDEYVDDLRRFVHIRIPALLDAFARRHPDHPDTDDLIGIEPDVTTRSDYYYAIANAGTATRFDTDAEGHVVANHARDDSHSQQWQVITLSNGYHHLVNRLSGQALTDPTEGPSTVTTNLSTQLCVAPADTADRAQQWHLVMQSGGRINLNNRQSDHTANLSGGRADDGTIILSYTNDSRNATSNNRLWTLVVVDSLTAPDAIDAPRQPDVDYALAYDPQGGRLHFGADDLSRLTFDATVYDAAGRPVLSFRAQDGVSVARLPRGLYVVAWQWQGRRHSAKFSR